MVQLELIASLEMFGWVYLVIYIKSSQGSKRAESHGNILAYAASVSNRLNDFVS